MKRRACEELLGDGVTHRLLLARLGTTLTRFLRRFRRSAHTHALGVTPSCCWPAIRRRRPLRTTGPAARSCSARGPRTSTPTSRGRSPRRTVPRNLTLTGGRTSRSPQTLSSRLVVRTRPRPGRDSHLRAEPWVHGALKSNRRDASRPRHRDRAQIAVHGRHSTGWERSGARPRRHRERDRRPAGSRLAVLYGPRVRGPSRPDAGADRDDDDRDDAAPLVPRTTDRDLSTMPLSELAPVRH